MKDLFSREDDFVSYRNNGHSLTLKWSSRLHLWELITEVGRRELVINRCHDCHKDEAFKKFDKIAIQMSLGIFKDEYFKPKPTFSGFFNKPLDKCTISYERH